MACDSELKSLCEDLVAQRFGSVHDAQQALERFEHLTTPSTVLAIVVERDGYERAYQKFTDKTDWVRPDPARHEIGMHVADILRKRCDDLTVHCQAQADEIKALRADAERKIET